MREGLLVVAKNLIYHGACAGNAARYLGLKARVTRAAARLGGYERPYMRLLPALVRPGDVVVDAGANVGAYTHALSALVGPSGRVLAFEPIPEVADALERSSAHLGNVSVIRQALSDRSNVRVRMTIPGLPGGVPEPSLAGLQGARLGGRALTAWRTFDVELSRLDDHQARLEGVRFIKADLEGHENQFLTGASDTIRRSRPVVQLEAAALDRVGILDWTGRLDYVLLTLAAGRLRPATAADHLSLNVYLVPSERRADLSGDAVREAER